MYHMKYGVATFFMTSFKVNAFTRFFCRLSLSREITNKIAVMAKLTLLHLGMLSFIIMLGIVQWGK